VPVSCRKKVAALWKDGVYKKEDYQAQMLLKMLLNNTKKYN